MSGITSDELIEGQAPGWAQETEGAHILEEVAEGGAQRVTAAPKDAAQSAQARLGKLSNGQLALHDLPRAWRRRLCGGQHSRERSIYEPGVNFGARKLYLFKRTQRRPAGSNLRLGQRNRRVHHPSDHG